MPLFTDMPWMPFSLQRFATLPRSLFIIDIDGTLVPDDESEPDMDTRHAMEILTRSHAACIASNGKNTKRNKDIARLFGIPYIAGTKPFGAVATAIRKHNKDNLPIVVVGDRYLTDGLLALRLQALFIPVRALHSTNETAYVRASYAIHGVITVVALALTAATRRLLRLFFANMKRRNS